MRRHKRIRVWLVLAALFSVLLQITSALAADPVSLTIQAPGKMNLGDEATVTAVLTDSHGRPVPGASVLLLAPSGLLSVEREVELDRATTDAHGAAGLRYQARSEDSVTLAALFPGNEQYSPSQASTDITVDGSGQLYQETAGVQLPVIGVWLLVGVLGVAWSVYFGVIMLVTLIARAEASVPER